MGGKKKGRARPKITLTEIVKNEMLIKVVLKSMTLHKIEWQKRIHVIDGWS